MLYRLKRHPFTPGLRFLKKEPGRFYNPDWYVVGQNKDLYMTLHVNIPGDTVGLLLQDAKVYQFFQERAHPAKLLLIDDTMCYVQTKYLVEVTDVLQSDTETNCTRDSVVPKEPG